MPCCLAYDLLLGGTSSTGIRRLLPLVHAHVMLEIQGWLQTGGIAWLGTLARCAASALLRRLGLGALLLVPSWPRPMRIAFCCVEMELPIQWPS